MHKAYSQHGDAKLNMSQKQAPERALGKAISFDAGDMLADELIDGPRVWRQVEMRTGGDLSGSDDLHPIAEWLERLEILELDNRELRHRLENFVPLVLSVIKLTAESSATVPEFRDALEGRLRAIANADAATRKGGDHCALEELLRLELSPYCRPSQFDLTGPSFGLPSEVAQSFSIIIHELTTNAVKHGALSCLAGRVTVRWWIESIDGTRASLRLEWLERGGPRATAGCKRGFGTTILCDDGKAITGGPSTLELSPEGLKYVLTTDLEF